MIGTFRTRITSCDKLESYLHVFPLKSPGFRSCLFIPRDDNGLLWEIIGKLVTGKIVANLLMELTEVRCGFDPKLEREQVWKDK